jgi:hypothetical protein
MHNKAEAIFISFSHVLPFVLDPFTGIEEAVLLGDK